MKSKYYFFGLLIMVLGCSKDLVTTPDFSGTYIGTIAGTDTYGDAFNANIKSFSDTMQVVVVKNGNNYVLKDFDSNHLNILFHNSNSFSIPSYENGNNINTGSGSFDDNSLTIQGNWRYTYTEEEYTDTSITKRNYKFIGRKNHK